MLSRELLRVAGESERGALVESTYRYPFPPNPEGWYLLCESASLAPGDVVPLHYFGRELVLYRTEGGRAVVADAHCPHMGAHLGYGGVVDGEGIRCPFHHWRYDVDGAPTCRTRPSVVRRTCASRRGPCASTAD